MSSIPTRIRFNDTTLAHAIDAHDRVGLEKPANLNQLIRSIFSVGLIHCLGNTYTNTQPSEQARNHLNQILMQTRPTSSLRLINQTIQANSTSGFQPTTTQALQSQSTFGNSADMSGASIPKTIPNKHLLQYLPDENQQAGYNMLVNMNEPNTTISIIKNLTSTNTRIANITYNMFSHCDTLTKEEQDAIDAYNIQEE